MTDGIGERLKYFRLSLKLTQPEMGKVMGKSAPTVQRYEAGTRNINKFAVRILRDKLGLNPDWLYTGEGAMTVTGADVGAVPVYSCNYNRWRHKETVGYFNLDVNSGPFRSLNPADIFMMKITEDFPPIEYGDYIIAEKSGKYKGDGFYLFEFRSSLKIGKLINNAKNFVTVDSKGKPFSVSVEETAIAGKIIWLFRNLSL